jgi:phosphoenolpyruvate phosphomutase
MKAIILNSGVGKRLNPLTDENPKCLTKLNGKTILGHEVENILHYGIKDFIITVGPFEEKIKKFMAENFPKANVTYVKNPDYSSTNAIYSLWLTRHLIDDDILIMHGDMVFDRRLLGNLLNENYTNCALVNNKIEPPKKDFKGKIENGIVKMISANISGKNAFFLAPIYKFSKDGFNLWLNEIDKFVKDGNVKVYGEDAFNNIPDKIKLYPVYFSDEFCMEIDDFDDLEIARNFFRNNKIDD